MSDHVDQKHPLTLLVALAITAAALGGAVYMMRRADARMGAMDMAVPDDVVPVHVLVAGRTSLPRTLTTRGFLSGIEEITVHNEVAGRVLARPVADGDSVRAGDVLMTIDETFHRLRVEGAAAELKRAEAQIAETGASVKQMEAQLTSAQAVLANRSDEHRRLERLHQSGNAPKIEYDRVLTALHTAQADLAAAEAGLARAVGQKAIAEAAVAIARASHREAQAYLDRCVVRSPVTGRVNRFFIEPGEYAVVTAPLVEIIRLDRMKMIIEVADTRLAQLSGGVTASVTADADATRVHGAELHHVSPKMDAVSRKFQVELHVDNVDESLLSGMYGTAHLHCGAWEGILRLPREAVFKRFGADCCLVVDRTGETPKAQLRGLELREIPGHLEVLEVLAGVEEGEEVVLSRRRELRDGVKIRIIDSPAVEPAALPAP